MNAFAKSLSFSFLLLIAMLWFSKAHAQSFPVNEWVKQLDSENIHGFKTVNRIVQILGKYDSTTVATTSSKMEEEGKSAGKPFHLRIQHLRIWYLNFISRPDVSPKTQPLLDRILKQAYETSDNKLIAYASWVNAHFMNANGNAETILMHKLKAVELFDGEEASENLGRTLIELGEHLFQTREYRQCIEYIQNGLNNFKNNTYKNYNTIGQAYQQLGMEDSAMYYFANSMQTAKTAKDTVWQGINALYKGQIIASRGAGPAAKKDLYFAYGTNISTEPTIAANALNWLGKIAIREKKLDSALRFLQEGDNLLKNSPPETNVLQVKNFLQQVYQTKAELYRILDKPDSADFYNALQISLKDSLQTVASNSSSKMSQLRIHNEKTKYALLSLQSEKEKEEQKRNFIIALITMMAVVAIIILNRQKKLMKYKQDLNQAQKEALIAEGEAARSQLQSFTRTLLEKTELLENLQKQVRDKSVSKEQQEWLAELRNQTILTEEDWTGFKGLFERLHPEFFIKLKLTFPDITGAEQRMAALSRLHVTAAQIAAMLGISVNSVYKTRQRLRQRLALADDTAMDQYLAQL